MYLGGFKQFCNDADLTQHAPNFLLGLNIINATLPVHLKYARSLSIAAFNFFRDLEYKRVV